MAFDRNETPFFTLLSPVKVGLWMVALDFFVRSFALHTIF